MLSLRSAWPQKLRVLMGLLTICAAASAAVAEQANGPAVERPLRIVCLGDSITDGHTYPMLIQAALKQAGKPVPVCLNAGVGGDTAAGMLKRLDADVFARKPDLVLLSVGINDLGGRVALPDFEQRVAAIIDQTLAQKMNIMLLTTTAVRNEDAQQELDRWNAALRKLANQKQVPVGDVAAGFAPAVAAGEDLWEADGCHLNFAGYRRIARGVLNGLGYPDVAVPEKLDIELEPGVIRTWRVRRAPDDQPLQAAAAAGLTADATWQEYTLPESEPVASWWLDDQRKRGFTINLEQRFGAGSHFQAISQVDSASRRDVIFRIGGELRTVWLNGQKLYQHSGGWHPRDVAATLEAGMNTILIETSPRFFVALVDELE